MSGRRSLMIANGGTQERPIEGQTGVWLYSGATVVSSGWKMTINSGVTGWTSQHIYSGGLAKTYIPTGSRVIVHRGGKCSSCEVRCGDGIFVSVTQGGNATDTAIYTGGLSINGYPNAGSAVGTTQYGGSGRMQNAVYLSGYILSAGTLTLDGGGGIKELYGFVGYGGSTTIGRGGANYNPVLHGGVMSVISAGEVYSPSLIGGELRVVSGSVTDATVASPAKVYISGTGRMSGATIESGGYLEILSGGTALAVTSRTGADIVVSDGGYIEYVTE